MNNVNHKALFSSTGPYPKAEVFSERWWRGRLSVLLLALGLQFAAFSFAQSLSLPDALAALPQSTDWQSAELRYQSSQRALESAYAGAGLQVRGSGSYNYSAPESGNSSSTNSLGLSASLNILPWSGANDQIRSAERNLEGAALDLRDSQANLAINLVNQYFTMRSAVSDLELAQANESLSSERVRVAMAQQAAGQITKENLLQTQQGLENARLTRLQAESNLENARISLYNGLGMAPQAVGLSTAPQALAMPQGNLDSLIAQALTRRSDVRKAQIQVGSAQDSLSIAQRDRWLPPASVNVGYGPRNQGGSAAGLSYSASLDLQSGNASVGVTQNGINPSQMQTSTNTLTLGLSISLPILSPSGDARIASTETALELARKSLESARKSAELDVRQRYLEASTATARLKVQQLGLENATQALTTAEARNKAGLNTALDLQQAQITLRQAQRDLEAATANQMVSVYRLLGSIGAFEQLPVSLGGK